MKVQAVSFAFTSSQVKNRQEENLPYFYTADIKPEQPKNKNHGIKVATAFLALSAVLITLFNIKGPKKSPQNIVELADKTKGLNKINDFKATVEELKSQVLYPIKCAINGDKEGTYVKKLKSGVILTDRSSEKLTNIMDAFMEHVKELGINTITISHSSTRTNSAGKKFTHKLKNNEIMKQVFNALDKGQKLYKEQKKYTVINLGDIAKLTNLKTIKSQKSNFEAMLANMNSKKFPGIVWAGWTTKTNDVPLFFNELPFLITKLTN